MSITESELLAEIERLGVICQHDDKGWTMEEWARQLGVCTKSARTRIKAAIAQGILEYRRVSRRAMDGRVMPHSVYVPKAP